MITYKTTLATFAVLLATTCARVQAQTPPENGPLPQSDVQGERPRMPDLTEASAKLGVTVDALEKALRDAGGPPPNLEKVAVSLSVTVEKLKEALPPPPRRPRR